MADRYGIVVDAGSSGSRLQVYRWKDPSTINPSQQQISKQSLHSVSKITQEKGWGFRVNPGLSSFANHPGRIWKKHLKGLVEFAEKIVPADKRSDTPIFVQATAGMRMLPLKTQHKILQRVCDELKRHSNFKIDTCQQIEVIDGETEGIYGWIALNYLEHKFDDQGGSKSIEPGSTFGFMGMGGASTQIAFVPSDEKEREKHESELYTVRLRNLDGTTQKWPVFVSTWLGFGANEAHRRHLRNLIMTLPEGVNYDRNGDSTYDVSDPCSQKGLKIQQQYKGITYDITGSGDYEQCMRMIYPLLLKHLPCKNPFCLFNGVSAPQIDFNKDRFIGVSEYWYTANDIFHMAGEYNFKQFERSLKGFCEADWPTVMDNYEHKKYGPNMRIPLLKDSCFKASWVINVLHEGFGLPRIGIEENEDDSDSSSDSSMFQSANEIEGSDLSWTLGKIVLYASSLIGAGQTSLPVGLFPSPDRIEQQKKYEQALAESQRDRESLIGGPFWWSLMILMILGGIFITYFIRKHPKYATGIRRIILKIQKMVRKVLTPVTGTYQHLAGFSDTELDAQREQLRGMEEGRFLHPSESSTDLGSRPMTLRTRSTVNLQDMRGKMETHSWNPRQKTGLERQKSGLERSESFSAFPLRTGSIASDIRGKRYPKFVINRQ